MTRPRDIARAPRSTAVRAAIAVLAVIAAVAEARGAPSEAPRGTPPATQTAPRPAEAAAARTALLDALSSDDRGRIERAVAAIAEPRGGADPDVMFAAARACEDTLGDPGRALALYDRIAAEHPSARVATAAVRRAAALRELVGPRGETAALARELAQLIAHADAEPADAVIRRGDQLAAAAWPGAPRAALWLGDWLRRAGRLGDAEARYATVEARWPRSPEARDALRGRAGCALDAHDWSRAEALAARLPAVEPADRIVRDDLLADAARGRRRAGWYLAAWLALAAAFAALAGSLTEAVLRTPRGARRGALRPPIEVGFLAPVAAVLVGVAFTAHRLIAPAVAEISAGGVALAWLSGAALERLRAAGRPRRLRATGHIVACLAGVAALGYIAVTRDGLLEALIETVRFGPEA
ncbi:MAG TPA: hypothetical protein VK607_13470 [Kofleriaceae bacterium]|nr:hypothetical protein [Kofleriaceae bacterium]